MIRGSYNIQRARSKNIPGWTIQPRSDLVSHPSILLLEITFQSHTLYAINIYNPSDSSALIPLYSVLSTLYNAEVIVTGDFNLHHPLWSKDEHDNKLTDVRATLLFSSQRAAERLLALTNPCWSLPIGCSWFTEDESKALLPYTPLKVKIWQ